MRLIEVSNFPSLQTQMLAHPQAAVWSPQEQDVLDPADHSSSLPLKLPALCLPPLHTPLLGGFVSCSLANASSFLGSGFENCLVSMMWRLNREVALPVCPGAGKIHQPLLLLGILNVLHCPPTPHLPLLHPPNTPTPRTHVPKSFTVGGGERIALVLWTMWKTPYVTWQRLMEPFCLQGSWFSCNCTYPCYGVTGWDGSPLPESWSYLAFLITLEIFLKATQPYAFLSCGGAMTCMSTCTEPGPWVPCPMSLLKP